ncbi:hypothetical protein VKT23_008988 [Stygiomarasmius scandens]|uniref:Uncharacterized protein n=1 Tax=Marasmiellus scandens TaxID=2682957 RepID=A0ABR1JG40_9AGAR
MSVMPAPRSVPRAKSQTSPQPLLLIKSSALRVFPAPSSLPMANVSILALPEHSSPQKTTQHVQLAILAVQVVLDRQPFVLLVPAESSFLMDLVSQLVLPAPSNLLRLLRHAKSATLIARHVLVLPLTNVPRVHPIDQPPTRVKAAIRPALHVLDRDTTNCGKGGCTNGTDSVIQGLGVCLSDLVQVPQASGTSSLPPLPSITGLLDPTTVENTTKLKLEWWQILLMALGCAFIFLVFLLCWRRRARKRRAEATKRFAITKRLDEPTGWRGWIGRLFGRRRKVVDPVVGVYPPYSDTPKEDESEEIKLLKLRNAEEARHNREMEKLMLIGDYQYDDLRDRDRDLDRASSIRSKRTSTAPSTLPSLYDLDKSEKRRLDAQRKARELFPDSNNNRLSGPSLYSQMTGQPRNGPDPKQSVKTGAGAVGQSRFSMSTLASSAYSSGSSERGRSKSPMTVTEEYALSVKPKLKLIDVDSPMSSRAPSPSRPVPAPAAPTTTPYIAPAPAPVPIPTFLAPVMATAAAPLGLGLGGGTGGNYWMTPNHTGASSTNVSSRNPFRNT